MPRTRRSGKARRTRNQASLLMLGVQALGVAAALWFGPLVFGDHRTLSGIATQLQSMAWAPAAVGILLLAAHLFKGWLVARAANEQVASEPAVNVQSRMDPGLQVAPEVWSPELFEAIEWRRFEAVVEALFAQAGFETRSQSHGADGGVDIWLHSKNASGPVSVVQCKHWLGKPVGVREMREFLGVMTAHNMTRGTYATSSTFTQDAIALAKAHGINTQDGKGLLNMILSRTPEQQAALLRVATEGDYRRPTCASCGVKMVERTPRKGGAAFWGCVNYPQCKGTLPMRQRAA